MSILTNKDISKMSKDEKIAKIQELRFSLMKGSIGANKAGAKTKEIKKAIARIMTQQNKQGGEKK